MTSSPYRALQRSHLDPLLSVLTMAVKTYVSFGAWQWKHLIYFFKNFVATEIREKILYVFYRNFKNWVAMEIHQTNPRSSTEAGGLFFNTSGLITWPLSSFPTMLRYFWCNAWLPSGHKSWIIGQKFKAAILFKQNTSIWLVESNFWWCALLSHWWLPR